MGGSCTGVCAPSAKKCSGNGLQTCSPNGQWGTAVPCGGGTTCALGVCAAPTSTPPSCQGLAANCGPSSNESCCASPLVTGGTYYRSYDGISSGYTSQAYPATVSDFRLDKYEITVGRFRKFVAVYAQNMITDGAGKNPNNPSDPGWNIAWNTNLPADETALQFALNCPPYPTWTSTTGTAETRPMNCLDWYRASAFCIWDGGRLPTEAEWNYAAAGGAEQRVYPWGAANPGPNANLAVYFCYYNGAGTNCMSVSNIAPVGSAPAGNGKYGQADLAGNLMECTQDSYAAYATPCVNCANLTASPTTIAFRGGSFDGDVSALIAASRVEGGATADSSFLGARCARSAP